MRTFVRGVLVSALVTIVSVATTFAQVQTGSLSVKAVDDQGAVMPGATVSITSPVLPRPVEGVTDAGGVFQVPGLVPGTYVIKVTLQGFQTFIREDVVLRQGQTISVDAPMKVGTVSEAVTVKGESPVVDTRTVGSKTNIDSALLETTPGGKDIWNILEYKAPGVVVESPDVGGNQGGLQRSMSARGTPNAQNTQLLNGVNVNDPAAQGFSMNYYIPSAFENIQVSTGAQDISVGTGGVFINMDRVAAAAGLAPDEFRRRNFIHPGDTLAVGQTIKEPVNMGALLDRALTLAGYHEKRERFARENTGAAIKKGVGFSTFFHGAGFTGSGEVHLSSVVAVEGTIDGLVRVLAASTEIGQGTNTIFSQIAADALGIAAEDVEVAQPDTAAVPDSGPTVASRTCMVVGKLVETAALGIRHILVDAGFLHPSHSRTEFLAACRHYVQSFGTLRATSQYAPPPGLRWDDEKYLGDAYGTYGWAAYVAEVTVDTTTWETRVDDFVAVQEVGRVINPTLATGQIEGGVAQGIGWALYEDVVWREGRMVNSQMTNYIMPTSMDLPEIRVFFEEVPYAFGPGGAKGIGELPMDGPAPAIFNAVAHATGADPTHLPLTPERLMALMDPVASALRRN